MKRNKRNISSWGLEPGPDIEGAEYHTGIVRLAAAILIQAYRDLIDGDLAAQVDAHRFLLEDAPIYCDALQINADPLEPITSGKGKASLRKKFSTLEEGQRRCQRRRQNKQKLVQLIRLSQG